MVSMNQVVPLAVPPGVGFSAAYLDVCKLRAEYRGISIEQLFKQEPELYKRYCRIVLEE